VAKLQLYADNNPSRTGANIAPAISDSAVPSSKEEIGAAPIRIKARLHRATSFKAIVIVPYVMILRRRLPSADSSAKKYKKSGSRASMAKREKPKTHENTPRQRSFKRTKASNT
jgi:hypothetical protein